MRTVYQGKLNKQYKLHLPKHSGGPGTQIFSWHITHSDPDKVYPRLHAYCTLSLSLYPDLCPLTISPKSTRGGSSQAAPAEAVHGFWLCDGTLPFASYLDLSLLAIAPKSVAGGCLHATPAEAMHECLLIDRCRTVLTAASHGTTQELNNVPMTDRHIPPPGNILFIF